MKGPLTEGKTIGKKFDTSDAPGRPIGGPPPPQPQRSRKKKIDKFIDEIYPKCFKPSRFDILTRPLLTKIVSKYGASVEDVVMLIDYDNPTLAFTLKDFPTRCKECGDKIRNSHVAIFHDGSYDLFCVYCL